MTRYDRLMGRLLDGRYRWGHASARTGHLGSESIRLLVYPPESTLSERRCARLLRLWPGAAAGTLVLGAPVLTALTGMSALAAALAPLLPAVAVRVVLGNIASQVKKRSVERCAIVSGLAPQAADRDRYEHLVRIAERLHGAERELDGGRITWDAYREIWHRNYWNMIDGS